MGNKHTFIDVSAYSSRPITNDPEENFDEEVLIPIMHYTIKSIQKFDSEKHLAGANVVRC